MAAVVHRAVAMRGHRHVHGRPGQQLGDHRRGDNQPQGGASQPCDEASACARSDQEGSLAWPREAASPSIVARPTVRTAAWRHALPLAGYRNHCDEASGRHTHSAQWSRGVATLLPRADQLWLYCDRAGEVRVVPWVEAEVLGRFQPQPELYPERFPVTGFPSDAQLQRLRACASKRMDDAERSRVIAALRTTPVNVRKARNPMCSNHRAREDNVSTSACLCALMSCAG